ncbi:cysteinyl leukotriene receptor 2-like [Argopecten irradians]|uniref:cysteinyl leukotriene receptor 2-like n=1 Tax=Argopecten irradians TaxID=31199 RepID=UPI00371CE198
MSNSVAIAEHYGLMSSASIVDDSNHTFNSSTHQMDYDNPTYSDYDASYLEMQNLNTIFTFYMPPILILIGSIGNILTLIVLRQKTFKPYSISFYVSSYAIANLLTLYLFLGSEWIAEVADEKTIDNRSDWLCRLWQFIMRVISFSGIWFVVAMVIDRYIVIWHPWKVSSMCTIFMAKFAAVIIIVGLVVVSIHAMWTYELMNHCFPLHNENDIHAMIWPWMSASFYSYIPLALLFTFNVLIVTGLCLKRPVKHTHNLGPHQMVLTHTTLALSTIYFLLVLPPTVMNVINKTFPPSWLQDSQLMLQIERARISTYFMAWVNTVILFCLCLLFSRTFRGEFLEIVTSKLCFRHQSRIYELQVGSQSSATQVEMDACTETTPL